MLTLTQADLEFMRQCGIAAPLPWELELEDDPRNDYPEVISGILGRDKLVEVERL